MLVEQTAGNQVALHLPKLHPDLSALGRVCPTFFQLNLGELPMTEVRRRDPRSSVLGPCTSAGPTMQSASAVFLVSRSLARSPPTGLRTASLTWPVSPKPPFDADGHVIFCKHLNSPIMGYYNTATWVVVRGMEFLDFKGAQNQTGGSFASDVLPVLIT